MARSGPHRRSQRRRRLPGRLPARDVGGRRHAAARHRRPGQLASTGRLLGARRARRAGGGRRLVVVRPGASRDRPAGRHARTPGVARRRRHRRRDGVPGRADADAQGPAAVHQLGHAGTGPVPAVAVVDLGRHRGGDRVAAHGEPDGAPPGTGADLAAGRHDGPAPSPRPARTPVAHPQRIARRHPVVGGAGPARTDLHRLWTHRRADRGGGRRTREGAHPGVRDPRHRRGGRGGRDRHGRGAPDGGAPAGDPGGGHPGGSRLGGRVLRPGRRIPDRRRLRHRVGAVLEAGQRLRLRRRSRDPGPVRGPCSPHSRRRSPTCRPRSVPRCT